MNCLLCCFYFYQSSPSVRNAQSDLLHLFNIEPRLSLFTSLVVDDKGGKDKELGFEIGIFSVYFTTKRFQRIIIQTIHMI